MHPTRHDRVVSKPPPHTCASTGAVVRALATCALLTLALTASAARAQPVAAIEDRDAASLRARRDFSPAPCPVTLAPELGEVYCGFVTVPETYEGPRTIRLALLVAKARTPSGRAPVLYLQGGPGYSAIREAPFILESGLSLGALHETRDLIFLDQRGAGFSEPALDCPELDDEEADASASLRACYRRLRGEGVNPSAYRTAYTTLDINRVRVALGYTKLSLVGTSYGTKPTLQRLRGSPAWLEQAALIAPIDPLTNVFENAPRLYQRSLELLDATCSADPRCLATYGHVRANVDAIVDVLALAPREVRFTDPTGEPQTLLLTAELVAEGLYELLAVTELLPVLPAALKEAADGSYELLAAIGYAYLAGDDERSEGMRLSVLCAEEVAHSSRARFVAAARGTDRVVAEHFTPAHVRGYFDPCDTWPVSPATPLLELPVLSHTGTLLVSGRYDTKTPPPYARSIARFLRDERVVEVEYGAHSSDLVCEASILTSFFAEPGRVEASCARRPLEFAYREAAPASSTSTLSIEAPRTVRTRSAWLRAPANK